MNLIVAVDEKWGIGNKNNLLFSIKQDMKFFRETTVQNTVIMGRKTLDSFPGGKPLKNRDNIVLTRDKNFKREGVTVCHSVDELKEIIKNTPTEKLFVIGGEQIYKLLLPLCDTAYVTKVSSAKEADAFMVNLDYEDDWIIERQSKPFLDAEYAYQFLVYRRK